MLEEDKRPGRGIFLAWAPTRNTQAPSRGVDFLQALVSFQVATKSEFSCRRSSDCHILIEVKGSCMITARNICGRNWHSIVYDLREGVVGYRSVRSSENNLPLF